ncbi:DUF955 domain-containing protein [Ectobacillus ponti]|uniref:DUF955 domain-containing protein n=1 Tax=Ectobacillus ponti TaxID=2961894 RepID=A0AA42BRD9_9BACI|nr:DUF955 domain-containing protein [Ectobacillus ponti]MCP8970827.1 DUF955 domain-containing protein [Ectobacillus ponti]
MYVNVCVCIAPGAETGNGRIARDFAAARHIWHPISFQAAKMVKLGASYTFADQEISYRTPFHQQEKVHKLLMHCLSLAPDADIYVCYVGGYYFYETGVIACAHSRLIHGKLKGFILMANGAAHPANMYTLAHEIGHVLLTRSEQGRLTNADPDSPDGLVHHPNPRNLMHEVLPVPRRFRRAADLLTASQRRTAYDSPILRPNPPRL